MTYSARNHVLQKLQGEGSHIAINEMEVTAILGVAYSRIVRNPSMSTRAAVDACFTD